ncbi:hypothetical protein PMIN03_001867 [Paraphaeosphaeria minitans]
MIITGEVIAIEEFGAPEPKGNLKETLDAILQRRWDLFARDDFNLAVEGCIKFNHIVIMDSDSDNNGEIECATVRERLYDCVVVHLEDNATYIPNFEEWIVPRDIHLCQRAAKPSAHPYSDAPQGVLLSGQNLEEAHQTEKCTAGPYSAGRKEFVGLMGNQEQSSHSITRPICLITR